MTTKMEWEALLEAAYADFHSSYYRERDPVSLVHRYPRPQDREVAALFAALLAYGNVQTILNNARQVLEQLGEFPYDSLRQRHFEGKFESFRHRFTTGDDIEILCHWIAGALDSHGSLEAFFGAGTEPLNGPLKNSLSNFVIRFKSGKLPKRWKEIQQQRSRNLKYLISDPHLGSACKRLNMFLRWMVRPSDGIDLGLWTVLHPSQLMLPVDTHLLQTIQELGWTRSKQASWKVVEQATKRLRHFAPQDPVRFDFALCHLSMAGKTIRSYITRKRSVSFAALE